MRFVLSCMWVMSGGMAAAQELQINETPYADLEALKRDLARAAMFGAEVHAKAERIWRRHQGGDHVSICQANGLAFSEGVAVHAQAAASGYSEDQPV